VNKASRGREEEARGKKKMKKWEEEGSRGGEEGTWSKKNNFEAKHAQTHANIHEHTHTQTSERPQHVQPRPVTHKHTQHIQARIFGRAFA